MGDGTHTGSVIFGYIDGAAEGPQVRYPSPAGSGRGQPPFSDDETTPARNYTSSTMTGAGCRARNETESPSDMLQICTLLSGIMLSGRQASYRRSAPSFPNGPPSVGTTYECYPISLHDVEHRRLGLSQDYGEALYGQADCLGYSSRSGF